MNTIKKNTIINNMKSILIFFMVLGHLMEKYFGNYLIVNEVIYSYIYWFHMPTFIFISGYLSKNTKSLFKKVFFRLFIPYIIFNTLYGIVVGDNVNPLFPNWYMWYILDLIFWRITTLLLERTKFTIVIIISIILSLLFRILPNIEILALSRLLIFYPYFVIGYYFTNNKLNILLNKKYRLISLISLISIIVINFYCITQFSCFPQILYRKGLNIICTNNFYKLLLVVFIEIITVIILASLINIIYRKKNKIFDMIGRNTIAVYLLHGYIIYLFGLFNFKCINNIVEIVIIAIAIVLVLSSMDIYSIYRFLQNKK